MKQLVKRFMAIIIVGMAPLLSFAEKSAEPASKKWNVSVELGYVNASGNTDETSTKARFDATREVEKWRYVAHVDYFNSEADGERSAEKIFLSNRLAYKFNDYDYSFLYHSYEDDRFSGFDYQTSFAAGLGRRLLLPPPMTWDIEAGPGYRVSKFDDSAGNVADGIDGDTDKEAIIRLFTEFTWDFSETSTFQQSLNVESGGGSTISKSVSSLSVRINQSVSLKLSYTLRYNNDVPDDTENADRETAVTLLYKFN